MQKKIFIKDSTFGHCIFSNNPLPPVQFTDKIIWDRSNAYTNEDIVVYTDNFIINSRGNNLKDIAWLIESEELCPDKYLYIKNNYIKFYKIFSHDVDILKLPNSVLIPYGGCWIDKKDFNIYEKNKMICMITSNKNFLSGHELRLKCIEKFKNRFELFGNGYKKIKSKIEVLKDFRFQIVIENSRKDFWFTEKIIDCFVTGTVPIYYGCPSIYKFFNSNGIITFDSLEKLDEILNNINEYEYSKRMPYIIENSIIANKYLLAENSIYNNI